MPSRTTLNRASTAAAGWRCGRELGRSEAEDRVPRRRVASLLVVARDEALAGPMGIERGDDAGVVQRAALHAAEVEGRHRLVERAADDERVVGRLRDTQLVAEAVPRRAGEVGVERRVAEDERLDPPAWPSMRSST